MIIDTPPVLGVLDAKALARLAQAIVFVLRWDWTKREAAQAALREPTSRCAPRGRRLQLRSI